MEVSDQTACLDPFFALFEEHSISEATTRRKSREDEVQSWRSTGWRRASRAADRGREGTGFHDGLGSRERLSAPVME